MTQTSKGQASGSDSAARGREELATARRKTRHLVLAAILFSIFVNLLMLTGPLYMLQIYDRVLGSRSEATLIALSLIVAFLFVVMGFLDHARSRLLARIGMRFQATMDERVFSAALSRSAAQPGDQLAASAQRDLESVQRFWTSPLSAALMDLPWTPIFLTAIFIFHPYLGWLALAGAAVLITLALANQFLSKEPTLAANSATVGAERLADRLKGEAEMLRALGMSRAVFRRWQGARTNALAKSLSSLDLGGRFTTSTRTLRLFLQSAILGLGAWLVLQDQLTPGAMIAGSIILGRALAPIEQSIGQWAILTRAREGRANLEQLLSIQPPEPPRTALPRPRAVLDIESVSLLLPGQTNPILRQVSFKLRPGQALGLIGPSGAGKSTLGRMIVGALSPMGGHVRLDGADLSQYEPDVLGAAIGYLPQSISLLDGTVAENIARMSPMPDPEKVVAAARAAAAHDMITALPQGYDTPIIAGSGQLSGGQIQRIGLARALYGDPVILVLDEPNSNLDNDGTQALNTAIRTVKAAGGAVVVIAHRPAAIQECDLLLMLEKGEVRAFGPRDDVLRSLVRNHTEIVRNATQGSVT